jgi:hypothetical protein
VPWVRRDSTGRTACLAKPAFPAPQATQVLSALQAPLANRDRRALRAGGAPKARLELMGLRYSGALNALQNLA